MYGNAANRPFQMTDSQFHTCLDKLTRGIALVRDDYRMLITGMTDGQLSLFCQAARRTADRVYGRGIFVRGLIEISNFCRNGCYYCGIRHARKDVTRYRLSADEILEACEQGYRLGFRTFVLQGGEDPIQDDAWVVQTVVRIKERYPDCAVTLSLGERSLEAYRRFREAGADRYLLRHETANTSHYALLHPSAMSLSHRMDCLRALKTLGFQTGAGMMIGSPGQTADCLLDDIAFLEELQPEMIGIGPFIPAAGTPFADESAGSLRTTILMLALLRLRFPDVLLPATTALATLHPQGRQWGFAAGANVMMPNLSPLSVRDKYALYAKKLSSGLEAAEQIRMLEEDLKQTGFHIAYGRGDHIKNTRNNEL